MKPPLPPIAVNTETQTLSQVLSATSLTELPTITRNPYDLVATAGTVSEDDPSGRGVGVSINGLRSAATNVLLDGVANNDEFGATVGQTVPLDSVQEIGIVTNNFTAEFGRATAGVINVTTKSGTNAFHGSLCRVQPRCRARFGWFQQQRVWFGQVSLHAQSIRLLSRRAGEEE